MLVSGDATVRWSNVIVVFCPFIMNMRLARYHSAKLSFKWMQDSVVQGLEINCYQCFQFSFCFRTCSSWLSDSSEFNGNDTSSGSSQSSPPPLLEFISDFSIRVWCFCCYSIAVSLNRIICTSFGASAKQTFKHKLKYSTLTVMIISKLQFM